MAAAAATLGLQALGALWPRAMGFLCRAACERVGREGEGPRIHALMYAYNYDTPQIPNTHNWLRSGPAGLLARQPCWRATTYSYSCSYGYSYSCSYSYSYICIYYICMYVCMYIYIYMYTYVCMYVCMYVGR